MSVNSPPHTEIRENISKDECHEKLTKKWVHTDLDNKMTVTHLGSATARPP